MENTKISKAYAGRAVTKTYIREQLKNGATDQQIKESFTLDKLNEMLLEFCEKYNFELIDQLTKSGAKDFKTHFILLITNN